MIYLFVLFYIIYLIIQYDFKGGGANGKKKHFYVLMIVMILVAGFRYRLGVDSIRYEAFYPSLPTFSQLSSEDFLDIKYDPLYLILAVACRTISSDFWVMQMAQAILVNVVFFRFFWRNTSKVFVAILLYYIILYLPNMTETMRESCAISMLLLGWEYYKDDKLIKVAFSFVMAFLFHSSAIICLPIFLLMITRLDKKMVFSKVTAAIAIGIILISPFVQAFFSDNINVLFFSDKIAGKVDMYTDNGMLGTGINIGGVISNMLLYAIIPYYCMKRLPEDCNKGKLEFFLVIETICAALSFPIFIFYRYINYFLPFVFIAICRYLSDNSVKKVFQSSALVLLILCGPYMLLNFRQMNQSVDNNGRYKNYMRYYPYKSIFTQEEDPDREALFNHYILF